MLCNKCYNIYEEYKVWQNDNMFGHTFFMGENAGGKKYYEEDNNMRLVGDKYGVNGYKKCICYWHTFVFDM